MLPNLCAIIWTVGGTGDEDEGASEESSISTGSIIAGSEVLQTECITETLLAGQAKV